MMNKDNYAGLSLRTIAYVGVFMIVFKSTVLYSQAVRKPPMNTPAKRIQTVTGFAHGFEEGTRLYLHEWLTGKIIDSSKIVKGQFSLKAPQSPTEKSRLFSITTATYDNAKVFWMDDADVLFSAVKGDFKNALVSGSATQQLNEEHRLRTEPLIVEIDSLRRNFGNTDSAMLRKTNDLLEQLKQMNVLFIQEYRQSVMSAYLLRNNCMEWGTVVSGNLYRMLTQQNQQIKYGVFVKQFLTYNKDITVGKNYVDFQQMTVEGEPVMLSSFKGRYVLLEFWASWCGPCRKENPALVKLYKQYRQQGFGILAVSLDVNKQQWRSAIEKDSLPWLNVSDLKGADNLPALMYGVYSIPDNFLIDLNGKIIAKNLRGAFLEKKLKELFAKAKSLVRNEKN